MDIVFDQEQSSGFRVPSICGKLMSFNLWEGSTSFIVDQIPLIYRESFSNEMELQAWFYLFWLKMFEFLCHSLPQGLHRMGDFYRSET